MYRMLFLLTLLLVSINVYSGEPVNTITSHSQKDLPLLSLIEKYLLQAYHRLGYHINFISPPSARTRKMIENGELDALTLRIREVAENTPHMLIVPVVLAEGDFVLYCQQQVDCSYEVLNDPEAVIGTLAGINLIRLYMSDHKASVYPVKHSKHLSKMFRKKRLDYLLTFEVGGTNAFNLTHLINVQKVFIKQVQGVHLIHHRHKDLLPSLTSSLKATIDELGSVPEVIHQVSKEQLKAQ